MTLDDGNQLTQTADLSSLYHSSCHSFNLNPLRCIFWTRLTPLWTYNILNISVNSSEIDSREVNLSLSPSRKVYLPMQMSSSGLDSEMVLVL